MRDSGFFTIDSSENFILHDKPLLSDRLQIHFKHKSLDKQHSNLSRVCLHEPQSYHVMDLQINAN